MTYEGIQITAGSAVITPNQMYAEMQTIGQKVDHLASVVDPAMSMMRDDILDIKKDLAVGTAECLNDAKAMDIRVRTLEHWRWFILGIAAVVGPAGGYVLARLFGGV